MISARRRCRGAALLVAVLLLVLGSASLLLRKSAPGAAHWRTHQESVIALHRAREALLAYAMNYTDVYNPGNYGTLPCPDLRAHGEPGNQDVPCGARHVNALGRLPWQTLGIPPPQDGSKACLWYAVSGSFKGGSGRTELLNADTAGAFLIDGRLAPDGSADRPAAVIIAPGRALPGQHRMPGYGLCVASYAADRYLESIRDPSPRPDQVDRLKAVEDLLDPAANDLLLPVYPSEIFALIGQRRDLDGELHRGADSLLARLGECLSHWMHRHARDGGIPGLPLPAPWVMADYRPAAGYGDRFGSARPLVLGRLPMHIDASVARLRAACAVEEGCADPLETDLRAYCARAWQERGVAESGIRRLANLWSNWKDHFFYSLSEPFLPGSAAERASGCGEGGACLSLQRASGGNASDWAAILGFGAGALPALRQSRAAPPVDADEKGLPGNLVEFGMQGNVWIAKPLGEDFNDVLYCINDGDDAEGLAPLQAGYCPGFAP